jgi:intracellular septation protein A
MGGAVVRRAARTAELEAPGLIEPSFRRILLGGLPSFLREGFLPLAAFYVGWRLSDLAIGIAASAVASVLVYAHERRAGRDALMVRLSLAFVVVQAIVGLLSHSTTVYLATPVVANAFWGVAFLGSAALRRPLAGALACAWYPFPPEFRKTREFRQVYGVESVVWGAYLLARSALRLSILLQGGVGSFVDVAFLTGTPTTLSLVASSILYAIRRFSDDDTADSAGAEARAIGIDSAR